MPTSGFGDARVGRLTCLLTMPSAILVPRLGDTMNENCLHLTLSSEYMIVCVQSIEESRMLSMHPCCFRSASCARSRCCSYSIICFSKLSDFFLVIRQKYVNFIAFTDSRRFLDTLIGFFARYKFVTYLLTYYLVPSHLASCDQISVWPHFPR